MSRPQAFDPRPDRRLASLDCAVQVLQDEPELRRELVRVHRLEAYRTPVTAIDSQLQHSEPNTKLRLIPDKG